MKKIFQLILSIGTVLLLTSNFLFVRKVSEANSGVTIGIEKQNEAEQIGPPWYDLEWTYRRPVYITNNGPLLSYYQVLVILNSSNFNFEKAKPDGSDIRFTGMDGTTELSYWIESWCNPDPQLAYIWVRVFPVISGSNTIYLYYNNGNPSVVSLSNGPTTFDGFDDNWGTITGSNASKEYPIIHTSNGIESQLIWTTISGIPTVSEGVLSLVEGTGVKSNLFPLYGAVGFRANFGSGNGRQWGGFINGDNGPFALIGDLPSYKDDLYLRDYRTTSEDILLPRIGGNDWHNAYHIYEVRWRDGQSVGVIDHGASIQSSVQTSAVPNSYLPVTFYNYINSGSTLNIDWVYIRQYRDPEPITTLGPEQGLVDLSIDILDSPDPVNTSSDLTYSLTISNNSNIEAPGVLVTDTLPTNVQFLWASSSQGCNRTDNIVICGLAPIAANSSANATIVVRPTADGIITNSAIVGSSGYEVNLNNNMDQVITTVDTVRPIVEWVPPFINRQTYEVGIEPVALQVSAIDNLGIQRVEFKWYDESVSIWRLIGTAYSPISPSIYQVILLSDILTPNVYNPIEAYAYDLAGNMNDISGENRQIIYIKPVLSYFVCLPLVKK